MEWVGLEGESLSVEWVGLEDESGYVEWSDLWWGVEF